MACVLSVTKLLTNVFTIRKVKDQQLNIIMKHIQKRLKGIEHISTGINTMHINNMNSQTHSTEPPALLMNTILPWQIEERGKGRVLNTQNRLLRYAEQAAPSCATISQWMVFISFRVTSADITSGGSMLVVTVHFF